MERSEDLTRLLRWIESGGTWEASSRGRTTQVRLCTCSGGEVMEEFSSAEADLAGFVARGEDDRTV